MINDKINNHHYDMPLLASFYYVSKYILINDKINSNPAFFQSLF